MCEANPNASTVNRRSFVQLILQLFFKLHRVSSIYWLNFMIVFHSSSFYLLRDQYDMGQFEDMYEKFQEFQMTFVDFFTYVGAYFVNFLWTAYNSTRLFGKKKKFLDPLLVRFRELNKLCPLTVSLLKSFLFGKIKCQCSVLMNKMK